MNRVVFLVLMLAVPSFGIYLSALIATPAAKDVPPKIVYVAPVQSGDVLGASTASKPTPVSAPAPKPAAPKPVAVAIVPSPPPAPVPVVIDQTGRDLILESGFTYDPSRDLASVEDVLNAIKGGTVTLSPAPSPTPVPDILIDTPLIISNPVVTNPPVTSTDPVVIDPAPAL